MVKDRSDTFVDAVAQGMTRSQAVADQQGLPWRSSGGGHTCLVGFSGGADSTALLAALCASQERLGLDLYACHVNHGLRGAESDRDEEFCARTAGGLSVPLVAERLTWTGHPSPCPPEEKLREKRYQALAQAARQVGAGSIVLAHTLDDQVETMLFRLLRGTAPAGLTGMDWARSLDGHLSIFRPLLSLSRHDCQDFLGQSGIEPVSDSSNLNLDYARNYIRHRLVPVAGQRFAGFAEHMDQLRRLLTEDEAYLSRVASETVERLSRAPHCHRDTWTLSEFRALPVNIKRRSIALALSRRALETNFKRIDLILQVLGQSGGGTVSLGSSWDLRAQGKFIFWVEKTQGDAIGSGINDFACKIKFPGLTIMPLLGKALRITSWKSFMGPRTYPVFPAAKDQQAMVDFSAISRPLVLRLRRADDTIRPLGMDQPVRLKKYLHTHKPAGKLPGDYGRVLVLADQQEVIWVPGWGLSNKVKVSVYPTHYLSLFDLAPDEAAIC